MLNRVSLSPPRVPSTGPPTARASSSEAAAYVRTAQAL